MVMPLAPFARDIGFELMMARLDVRASHDTQVEPDLFVLARGSHHPASGFSKCTEHSSMIPVPAQRRCCRRKTGNVRFRDIVNPRGCHRSGAVTHRQGLG